MIALPTARAADVAARRRSLFFWITRDRVQHRRLLRGSIALAVPRDRQDGVLSSACEDWCFDNLDEGVLAEWVGLDLTVHFVSGRDAMVFKLRWL